MSEEPKKNIKILLVEDEPDIRGLYAQYLEDSGYTVYQAADGLEGTRMALSMDWDLMLLDIVLPGHDGLALLKDIKSNFTLKNRPVILLTNMNIETAINEAFGTGAESFLIKSEITPDKILNEIEAVIKKYTPTQ